MRDENNGLTVEEIEALAERHRHCGQTAGLVWACWSLHQPTRIVRDRQQTSRDTTGHSFCGCGAAEEPHHRPVPGPRPHA